MGGCVWGSVCALLLFFLGRLGDFQWLGIWGAYSLPPTRRITACEKSSEKWHVINGWVRGGSVGALLLFFFGRLGDFRGWGIQGASSGFWPGGFVMVLEVCRCREGIFSW